MCRCGVAGKVEFVVDAVELGDACGAGTSEAEAEVGVAEAVPLALALGATEAD